MWCEPCEVHLAPPFWPEGQRREPWDRTWYAQQKEDCPLSGPLTTADEVDQMFADHLHTASGEPVCDAPNCLEAWTLYGDPEDDHG